MKKWTDEECTSAFEGALNEMDSLTDYDRQKERLRCMAAVRKASNDLIRAAVAEARREEREACAEIVRSFHGQPHDDASHSKIAAAILVRGEKEPRDAER